MTDMTLKPCLCGTTPEMKTVGYGLYEVVCPNCKRESGSYSSRDTAAYYWERTLAHALVDVLGPALAVKDALHEAVVVALDHLTAGLGKREDVILELREAHLRAADVDHANRSLSPKEIRIKELGAALAAAEARIAELEAEVAEHRRHVATVMQREAAANKRVRELEAELAALKAPKAYHYHDVDDFYKPETCERCKWFNDHDIMWCDREGGPGTSTGTREAPSCDKWEGKGAPDAH